MKKKKMDKIIIALLSFVSGIIVCYMSISMEYSSEINRLQIEKNELLIELDTYKRVKMANKKEVRELGIIIRSHKRQNDGG